MTRWSSSRPLQDAGQCIKSEIGESSAVRTMFVSANPREKTIPDRVLEAESADHKTACVRLEKSPIHREALAGLGRRPRAYALTPAVPRSANIAALRVSFSQDRPNSARCRTLGPWGQTPFVWPASRLGGPRIVVGKVRYRDPSRKRIGHRGRGAGTPLRGGTLPQ